MIIAMRENCLKGEIAEVLAVLKNRNVNARIISPGPRVVLGIVEEIDLQVVEQIRELVGDMAGVETIETFDKSWKLVSRSFRPDTSTILVGTDIVVGGKDLIVMGGPCAVESEKGIMEIARAISPMGTSVLRGGAFKPRTSPYSFRGLEEEGLKYLAEAGRATGMPIVTEVLNAHDVELVAGYADILQIGARNMQNFALLEAVGDTDKPVLLKRGMMATIKELLLSAEYILARGNWQVMLCERGIRTFETETRNTLDISAVPLLKEYTHLPVVVDPSHAAGKRELVPAMAKAAVAAGADAIMVEVHTNPEIAFSDGRQTLTLDAYSMMMQDLKTVAEAVGRTMPGVAK